MIIPPVKRCFSLSSVRENVRSLCHAYSGEGERDSGIHSCNHQLASVGEFSTGIMGNFQPEFTLSSLFRAGAEDRHERIRHSHEGAPARLRPTNTKRTRRKRPYGFQFRVRQLGPGTRPNGRPPKDWVVNVPFKRPLMAKFCADHYRSDSGH